MNSLDWDIKNKTRIAQENEITEYHVYNRLAQSIKDPQNNTVVNKM